MKSNPAKLALWLTAWLAFSLTAPGTDFTAWRHRMAVTFAPGTAGPLNDFPALIVLSTNLPGLNYSQFASASGNDLRFSDAEDGSEFPYEIESWDTNGESTVWVRVPSMAEGTVLLAFWGNAAADPPPYTTDGSTWDSDYLGIWHLHENLLDATGNGNDGTGVNNADGQGKIAHGEDFNGIDAYVRLEETVSPPPLGASHVTLSAWFLRRGGGDGVNTGTGGLFGVEPILTKGRAEADGDARDMNYFLGIRPSDRVLTADLEEGAGGSRPGQNHPIIGSTAASDGLWHHAAVTYDGTWRLYLNGAPDGEVYVGEPMRADSIEPAAIAATLNSLGTRDGAFNGFIDEARISRVARSADWIHACWLNVVSNRSFCAYGPVETIGPDAPRVRTDPATNITTQSAWLNGYLVSTGSSATAVTFFWGQTDGGTNAAAWAEFRELGPVEEGPFSALVTGLTAGVTHYFRCMAANADAVAWSTASRSFIPADWVDLVVVGDPKPYGSASPYDYGIHHLRAPLTVTNTLFGSPVTDPTGTRYAAAGWIGSGSVPPTGAGNVVTFTILTNSSLTWLWQPTHQYLTVNAGPGGTTDTGSGWHAHNSTVTVLALPDPGFVFNSWTGDLEHAQIISNTVELLMDQPRSVTAHFQMEANAVGGTLASDTTWQHGATPYLVAADLIVPVGITLTVEPGVEVRILSGRQIRVYGTLTAQGTEDRPVRFNNHPAQPRGGYISFEGGGLAVMAATGVFERCSFTALQGPIAVLDADDAWLTVVSCSFSNMPGKVMRPSDCRVTMVGNRMHDTGEGINLLRCAGLLSSNVIWNVLGDADALDVDYSWTGPGNGELVLEWNDLTSGENSNADGIDVSFSDAVIRYNSIKGFADKAVSLGPQGSVFLYNNMILDCNIGIAIKDSSAPSIINNTIYGCSSYGIHSYEKGEGGGGPGRGSMTNTVVWDCGQSIVLDDNSTLQVGYSIVNSPAVWPGPGNLNDDPLFNDPAAGDLRVTGNSPCINSGLNLAWFSATSDLDGNPRVLDGTVDIGAYEYAPLPPPRMLAIWNDSQSSDANIVFSWHSMSNQTYAIEYSTNLLGGWGVLTNNLTSTPPSNVYTDHSARPPRVFYRILLEESF